MKFLDNNTIQVDPPKRPKKITGTRFASIFGLNKWNTPFKTWCEITKTYEEPFEDTKYTIAGKVIEPKQAEYMKKAYFMPNLKTPTDVYGKDYFNKTYGDFFKENKIFGGMWDYLDTNGKETTTAVLEMKTTKRSEDWLNADGKPEAPEYYSMQASLYAYLKGVDNVIMVVSFLDDEDYEHPENYVCNAENTQVLPFKVSEKYPNFPELVEKATEWWKVHVEGGVSPEYDEKKDADILKALRTNNLNPNSDIEKLMSEADDLIQSIAQYDAITDPLKKRLDNIKDQIKEYAKEKFGENDDEVKLSSNQRTWTLSRSSRESADVKKLKADGLTNYIKTSTTYTLTNKPMEEK